MDEMTVTEDRTSVLIKRGDIVLVSGRKWIVNWFRIVRRGPNPRVEIQLAPVRHHAGYYLIDRKHDETVSVYVS